MFIVASSFNDYWMGDMLLLRIVDSRKVATLSFGVIVVVVVFFLLFG